MSTLPWNAEAEQAILSALLLDPDKLPALSAVLAPEDFYASDLGAVYGAMQRLSQDHMPVDVVTLRDEIDGELPSVVTLTPQHTAPLSTYADIIRRDAFRRRYISSLRAAERMAFHEDNPQTLVADLQERMAFLIDTAGAASDALGMLDLEAHREPPKPPLLGVLSPEGTTILYGNGGDGKGWVAARWAASLDCRVAILDFEMHPGEWAYRLERFGKSLDDVLYFSPSMPFDQWANESAARFLRDKGVQYLVIDSAMYASNVDDPYSPNGALAYGRARRRLDNLPALLLAHTTGGQDKVFGSVFWRNESRVVWRLGKDFDTRQRYLECRKANNYSSLEGRRYSIDFSEERGVLTLLGSVA